MDIQSSTTIYSTNNSNDHNYLIAKKDYMNFINMKYLTSGIFFSKNLHNGLFEKKNNTNNENNKNK